MTTARATVIEAILTQKRMNWAIILLVLVFAGTTLTLAGGDPAPQSTSIALENKVIEIFEANCTSAGCHGASNPQLGLKLTADAFYARTVNQPAAEVPQMMRVKPGEPENSYLVKKVTGAADIVGLQMPFGRDQLTPDEVSTIIAWVKSLDEVDQARMQADTPDPVLPFGGWKVLNTPTSRMVDKGDWLFLISHRFVPDLGSGYDSFFGIDGSAIIFLNLGYAFSDDFFVNLGRTNNRDNVELNLKYGLKQQYDGDGLPFAAALQANVNWLSEKPIADSLSRLRSDALKYSFQAILSSEVIPGYALNVVPGIMLNPNSARESEDPLITLGLGGRIHIWNTISLIGEWTPILSGYTTTMTQASVNRFDSWGGGIEIFLRGHVFQIVVSNAAGMSTDQYMNGGDLDIRDGDMRLGFSIFRQL